MARADWRISSRYWLALLSRLHLESKEEEVIDPAAACVDVIDEVSNTGTYFVSSFAEFSNIWIDISIAP